MRPFSLNSYTSYQYIIIIPNIAPHVRFIAIILITILHLGSLQLTFSRVLFFSWELVFAAFCSRPQMPVMNESWRISRMAGGKKISQPMQELLEDDDVARVRGGGLGRKKKRQHERSGVHGSRREREKCLPTTSAFRMIDRSRCSSGRWSLMISIGWEPDPLLTLSSIISFPRAFSTFVRLETRYGKCRENRQIRGEESATFKNYAKLFL